MKQFKSILLGISLFLLHSCNLLDVDTVSSITGDGYWNTKGDVESYKQMSTLNPMRNL